MRLIPSRIGPLAFAALAALSLALTAPCRADQQLQRMIEQLESSSLQEREAASEWLTQRDLRLRDLTENGVDLDRLSAEQRSRLDLVLFETFKRSPRAGLGVGFDQQSQRGVRLQTIQPNFPSARFLRPGDVVTGADGVDFTTIMSSEAWNAFRFRILSYAPGESIPLTLVRDGETMELDVPLGDYADLQNAATPSDHELAAAWSFRRIRLGLALHTEAPISSPDGAWPRLSGVRKHELMREHGMLAGGAPGSVPVVRLPEITRALTAQQGRRPTLIVRPGQQQADGRQGQRDVNVQAVRQALIAQITHWENILADARDKAENPALDPVQRARWSRQVERAEEMLDRLHHQLDTLDNRDD